MYLSMHRETKREREGEWGREWWREIGRRAVGKRIGGGGIESKLKRNENERERVRETKFRDPTRIVWEEVFSVSGYTILNFSFVCGMPKFK